MILGECIMHVCQCGGRISRREKCKGPLEYCISLSLVLCAHLVCLAFTVC
jgi:hypothetical protein